MIDVGIKIEIANASGSTVPVAGWLTLTNCTAMPSLIQPSTKIPTDYIGEEFIGEMLGKRVITGLDFAFAYDGGTSTKQYRKLSDMDDNNEQRWFKVTYPDGTKFQLLVECEVTLVAPTPSGEIGYTLSITPVRQEVGELIIVVYPEEPDPLGPSYTITNTLTKATSNNSSETVLATAPYAATITADEGYTLVGATATVTMGGVDITSTAYAAGVITVESVTGNVVITVTAASST